MTRFRFRLDRILELRRREEEGRARELGVALRAQLARERERARVAEECARAGAQFAEAQGDGMTAGQLANLDMAREAAGHTLEGSEQRLDAARGQADAGRERFSEARRERRRVEMLRERRVGEWQVESAREERRTLDDIASRRTPTGRNS